MVERSAKRQKKNFLSEEDISTVLHRYKPITVLALLQEVALEVQDAAKIDWNALVRKTTTEITSAREYQMLWRHLAYRDSVLDTLDHVAQPLDDDSDLECELETFPAVSSEASAEAAACVKVLIASAASNDPTSSTVEAPLTISIPKGLTSKAPENSQSANCTLATHITVPITVQMQPMTSNTSTEGLNSIGAANATVPKRRRKWTLAEDQELEAAVQKCGEGNWANILKGDFKGDRTASQLSQRWTILKKNKKGNLKVGTASQISDVHLATRRAVLMAIGDSTMPSCSLANAGASSNGAHSKLGQPASTETSNGGAESLPPSQHDTATGLGPSGSSKARVAPKKPPSAKTTPDTMVTKSNLNTDSMASKTTLSPDSLVKAAAVAAGARIATASDAASLLKAAQSKNAVYIMPGCSLIKSSIAGSSSSLPSNVHLIRTGPPSRPLSSYSTAPSNASQPNGTHRMQGPSPKPAAVATQPNSAAAAPPSDLNTTPETKSGVNSVPSSGTDTKTVENTSSNAAKTIKRLVLEGQANFTGKASSRQLEGDQSAISSSTPMDVDASGGSLKDQEGGGKIPVLSKSPEEQAERFEVSVSAAANASKVPENPIDSAGSRLEAGNGDHEIDRNDKTMTLPVKQKCEIPMANEEICENGGASEIKEGAEEMVVDGNEGQRIPIQQATGNDVKC